MPVRTLEFHDTVLHRASQRNDNWGNDVYARICSVIDVVAAEARYHEDCRLKFFLMTDGRDAKRGRPKYDAKAQAFKELCHYLDDNDECQYSLPELLECMDQYLPSDVEGYTLKYLKIKLKEHYGQKITITSISGKSTVISLRDVAHKILRDK